MADVIENSPSGSIHGIYTLGFKMEFIKNWCVSIK